MTAFTIRNAVKAIEARGVLLVFPIKNQKEPASLWSEFFPRSQMRWEWDSGADNRVPALWILREELSRSKKVVYAKWFRGRATFFSREIFTAYLACIGSWLPPSGLNAEARGVLQLLEEDSPLSTKQLKKQAKLEGRFQETAYNRALKELWKRLLVVGFGEVDDGAFPSLAMGATQTMFEELWRDAEKLNPAKAEEKIRALLGETSLFYKDFQKLKKTAPPKPAKGPQTLRYGGWEY